jgi:hypothetical protein
MNRKQHTGKKGSATTTRPVPPAEQIARLDQSFAEFIDGKTVSHVEANEQVTEWLIKSAGVEPR